jgi:hypothetical protein
LHQTCHDIKRKAHYNFAKLFFHVKISFCLASVQALDHISKDATIASRILHIAIGTETLDQYKRTINERDGVNEAHRVSYLKLYQAERDASTNMLQTMDDICLRLPSLESLRIQDRPSKKNLDHHNYYRASRCGMGSAELYRQTGIDLSGCPQQNVRRAQKKARSPEDSRRSVIETVLELLCSLREAGVELGLYNVLRGDQRKMYGVTQVVRGDDIGWVLGKGHGTVG